MTDDKIKRVQLDDLEIYAAKLISRGENERADEAVLLQHLIASLRANAERDLLMAHMSARFDQLERSFHDERALHSEAYRALVNEFRTLQRQQDDLRANQEAIAAIVDAGAAKIAEAVRKIDRLTESVEDVTEP